MKILKNNLTSLDVQAYIYIFVQSNFINVRFQPKNPIKAFFSSITIVDIDKQSLRNFILNFTDKNQAN